MKNEPSHPTMRIRTAARAAHEANRVYCIAIGDHSQLPWEEAPDWQRESAIEGAKNIAENPDMTPMDSHEKWCEHKRSTGWRWGFMKDVAEKRHPCMVVYEKLPHYQRMKDTIFIAVVKGVLGKQPPTLLDVVAKLAKVDPNGVTREQLRRLIEMAGEALTSQTPHEVFPEKGLDEPIPFLPPDTR